jgi:hypothetical protein
MWCCHSGCFAVRCHCELLGADDCWTDGAEVCVVNSVDAHDRSHWHPISMTGTDAAGLQSAHSAFCSIQFLIILGLLMADCRVLAGGCHRTAPLVHTLHWSN